MKKNFETFLMAILFFLIWASSSFGALVNIEAGPRMNDGWTKFKFEEAYPVCVVDESGRVKIYTTNSGKWFADNLLGKKDIYYSLNEYNGNVVNAPIFVLGGNSNPINVLAKLSNVEVITNPNLSTRWGGEAPIRFLDYEFSMLDFGFSRIVADIDGKVPINSLIGNEESVFRYLTFKSTLAKSRYVVLNSGFVVSDNGGKYLVFSHKDYKENHSNSKETVIKKVVEVNISLAR